MIDFLRLPQSREPRWLITPYGGQSLHPHLLEFLAFEDPDLSAQVFQLYPLGADSIPVSPLDDNRVWSAQPRGLSVEPYDNIHGILGWLPEIETIAVSSETVELVWRSRVECAWKVGRANRGRTLRDERRLMGGGRWPVPLPDPPEPCPECGGERVPANLVFPRVRLRVPWMKDKLFDLMFGSAGVEVIVCTECGYISWYMKKLPRRPSPF